jgi:hypothetical protein
MDVTNVESVTAALRTVTEQVGSTAEAGVDAACIALVTKDARDPSLPLTV